jgi:hypothetical protein
MHCPREQERKLRKNFTFALLTSVFSITAALNEAQAGPKNKNTCEQRGTHRICGEKISGNRLFAEPQPGYCLIYTIGKKGGQHVDCNNPKLKLSNEHG